MKITEHFIKHTRSYLLNLIPRAGQIVRRYFHAEDLRREQKTVHDFVTAADLAVNDFLHKELTQKYPDIPILTEEADHKSLNAHKNKPLLWIIDPLDGTTNFSRGDSNFSISIALVSKAKPVIGVIFIPTSSKLMWATTLGKHAYMNGRRMKVSAIATLEEAVVCTDWSHILHTRDATTHFLKTIYGHIRQVKILGSAATDITLLARGGVDIYHHVHLYPWDTAAAGLIAEKAGATVTDTNNKPWNAFSEGILAANPTLHQAIIKLISKQ